MGTALSAAAAGDPGAEAFAGLKQPARGPCQPWSSNMVAKHGPQTSGSGLAKPHSHFANPAHALASAAACDGGRSCKGTFRPNCPNDRLLHWVDAFQSGTP
jgi:hypothetical protein